MAWVLVAWVYSFGLFNAFIRRRWRRRYGDPTLDHSVVNFFAIPFDSYEWSEEERRKKAESFKRDFSLIYVVMFIFTHLFSRAVSATETSTGLTSSPWAELLLSALYTFPISLAMMVITSMFDYALSMFVGKGHRVPVPGPAEM